MAKLLIQKATTDVALYIFIQDSSQTDGRGLTGLVFNSASLTCYYVRPLGSATQLTLATQTVTGAHSDGGFVEVSSTNMPGVYRLDLSDAICATGVNSVVVMLKGAANMAPVVLEIQLVSYDPNDSVPAVDVTQWNGANVASPHTAGYPVVTIKDGTGTGEIDTTSGGVLVAAIAANAITATAIASNAITSAKIATDAIGAAQIAADAIGSSELAASAVTEIQSGLSTLTAAQVNAEVDTAIADARLDELLAADSDIDGAAPPTVGSVFHELLTKTAGSFTYDQTTDSLEALRDNLATASALSTLQTSVNTIDDFLDTEIASIITTLGTPAGASISADIAAIEAQTDDIGVAGAGLTAVPWNSAWDAEVQSEVQDAIEVNNLDHLVKIAVDTDFATTVHLNSVVGHLADNGTSATFDRTTDSLEALQGQVQTIDDFLDTEVAAILADTNELQTDWTNGGRLDLLIDAIKAKTDNLPSDPADASDIAALFATVNTKLDTIDDFLDSEVAAILADTNELQTDWVDGGRLDLILDARASQASVDAVDDYIDTEIAAIKAKTDQLTFTVANRIDANDIDRTGYALTTTEHTNIADETLTRDWTAVVVSIPDRCLLQAARFLRNKWDIVAGILRVYKENGTDVAWQKNVSTTSNPDGVTGVDNG